MLAAAQWFTSKAEPQNKGLTLYTLANRLQKQKARFHPYRVVCSSIGYFVPNTMWPSRLDFFKFYLTAMPSLPSCCIIRTRTCLFLSLSLWPSSLLHRSPLWCSDPPRVKEHHLDLELCIFMDHRMSAVFLSVVASIVVLMEAEIRRIAVWSQPGANSLGDPIWKNIQHKTGWWSGSSGRAPAYQPWGPEFKL
jgi:hypothetical protein